jgi:hypothetical protein
MSKLIRVLALVAMVAAMHLAGMAVVAQAHPADQVTGQDARRKRPPATSRPTTMDAAVRQLLRDRSSIPSGTPAQMPAPPPAESSGQSGWLVASLGVLAAAMALIAGLAVLVARRAKTAGTRSMPVLRISGLSPPASRRVGTGISAACSGRKRAACSARDSPDTGRQGELVGVGGRSALVEHVPADVGGQRPATEGKQPTEGVAEHVDRGAAGLRRAGVSRRTGRSAVRDAGPDRSRSAAAGPACP